MPIRVQTTRLILSVCFLFLFHQTCKKKRNCKGKYKKVKWGLKIFWSFLRRETQIPGRYQETRTNINKQTENNNNSALRAYIPVSHCIDQAGLGAFTAKSGRKHYNPPLLTVMWMNFDSPNFPSFCSLSAIISFQTCRNKCILYVLSFHKCIKIKYKMVNMYGVFRD